METKVEYKAENATGTLGANPYRKRVAPRGRFDAVLLCGRYKEGIFVCRYGAKSVEVKLPNGHYNLATMQPTREGLRTLIDVCEKQFSITLADYANAVTPHTWGVKVID